MTTIFKVPFNPDGTGITGEKDGFQFRAWVRGDVIMISVEKNGVMFLHGGHPDFSHQMSARYQGWPPVSMTNMAESLAQKALPLAKDKLQKLFVGMKIYEVVGNHPTVPGVRRSFHLTEEGAQTRYNEIHKDLEEALLEDADLELDDLLWVEKTMEVEL